MIEMVSLNFTTGVEKILAGKKQMSIRVLRKRPFKVGDNLQLFTGLRTRNCKRLSEEICIFETLITWRQIRHLKNRSLFAKLDGFENWNEMENWFNTTHNITRGTILQIVCWGQRTKKILETILKEVEEK